MSRKIRRRNPIREVIGHLRNNIFHPDRYDGLDFAEYENKFGGLKYNFYICILN